MPLLGLNPSGYRAGGQTCMGSDLASRCLVLCPCELGALQDSDRLTHTQIPKSCSSAISLQHVSTIPPVHTGLWDNRCFWPGMCERDPLGCNWVSRNYSSKSDCPLRPRKCMWVKKKTTWKLSAVFHRAFLIILMEFSFFLFLLLVCQF